MGVSTYIIVVNHDKYTVTPPADKLFTYISSKFTTTNRVTYTSVTTIVLTPSLTTLRYIIILQ